MSSSQVSIQLSWLIGIFDIRLLLLQVQPLPYLCGGFFVNQALTCSESIVFTPERGDRLDAPDVIIALISRPPPRAEPICKYRPIVYV